MHWPPHPLVWSRTCQRLRVCWSLSPMHHKIPRFFIFKKGQSSWKCKPPCLLLEWPGDRIGPLYPRHIVRGDDWGFPIKWSTTGLPNQGCIQLNCMYLYSVVHKRTSATSYRRVGHCKRTMLQVDGEEKVV